MSKPATEWTTLECASRRVVGVACGYSIRKNSKCGHTFEVVVSGIAARKAGLEHGDNMVLQTDNKGGLRLARVAQPERDSRKLHIRSGSGRAEWSIPCTGIYSEIFGTEPAGIVELELVSAASGAVVMRYEVENETGGNDA